MPDVVCWLRPDLAELRVLANGQESVWRRAEPSEEESGDALWWRQQADAAARWIVETCSPGTRLHPIVLTVEDASCIFVAAPSDDPSVLAAALRQDDAGWDELGVVGAAQALTEPGVTSRARAIPFLRRPTEQASESARFAAIAVSDGLARLWLDALDKRSIGSGVVTTLWHAAALAWGDPVPVETPGVAPGGDAPPPTETPVQRPLCAVVLDCGDRLVWSWSRAGNLLAAGSETIPQRATPVPDGEDGTKQPAQVGPDLEAAVSRLALNWLTWSAQLGAGPDRMVLVAPDPKPLTGRLERTWPDSRLEPMAEAEPLAATVKRLAAPGPTLLSDSDPRRALVTLSRRRGRAHRRLYTAACVAIAFLAVAAFGLGLRWRDAGAELDAARASLSEETRAVVGEVSPPLATNPDPVRALQSELIALRNKRPVFSDPAPARDIIGELERLSGVFADLGPDGLKVEEIVMHEQFPTAQVLVPTFAVGEELRSRLNATPGRLRWEVSFQAQLGQELQRWRLTGGWEASQ